jgi:hypothetical protein
MFSSQSRAAGAETSGTRVRIERFEIKSAHNQGDVLRISSNGKNIQTYDLELGEDWEGDLILKGDGPIGDVKVTVSHINFMSLSAEGPHLDLVNWRTFKSGERILSPKSGHTGVFTLDKSELNTSAFPFVSKSDLMAEIKRHILDKNSGYGSPAEKSAQIARWSKLAEECPAPQVYPCAVGAGLVILRFYAPNQSPGADPFKELRLNVPMGC